MFWFCVLASLALVAADSLMVPLNVGVWLVGFQRLSTTTTRLSVDAASVEALLHQTLPSRQQRLLATTHAPSGVVFAPRYRVAHAPFNDSLLLALEREMARDAMTHEVRLSATTVVLIV